MSVLKNKRSESKAEFVNIAYKIYVETMQFLTKLSNRYSRLVAQDIMSLASRVLTECESANSIFPHDQQRVDMRFVHLTEARAALMALDVQLSVCYELMMLNPAGCFTTATGNKVSSSDAKHKLDRLAENIGGLIDQENGFIIKVINSDKERIKK